LDKVKDDSPDIVLTQSAEIMADIVTGARPATPPQKTARRS
jgi:hypothetical protein